MGFYKKDGFILVICGHKLSSMLENAEFFHINIGNIEKIIEL